MWEFFLHILKNYGVLGIFSALELGAIFWLYRKVEQKDALIGTLHKEIKTLSEKRLEDAGKRLEDVVEDRERYEDLTKELTSNLDVVIKMVSKYRNGTNNS